MKKTKGHQTDVEDAPQAQDQVRGAESSVDDARAPGGEGESADGPEVQPTMEDLHDQIARLEDSVLRAKADYQNLQRRLTNERQEAVRFANADLMRALVGVLDDLERALESARSSDNVAAVAEGVRIVYDHMLAALQSHGLEPIEAVDKPFDPNVHEAMMQQPSAEHAPGTVMQELARGYKLRDRVIRPSKVIVSKAPDGPGVEA